MSTTLEKARILLSPDQGWSRGNITLPFCRDTLKFCAEE